MPNALNQPEAWKGALVRRGIGEGPCQVTAHTPQRMGGTSLHCATVISRNVKGMGAGSEPQCVLMLLGQKSQQPFNLLLPQGPSQQDSWIICC